MADAVDEKAVDEVVADGSGLFHTRILSTGCNAINFFVRDPPTDGRSPLTDYCLQNYLPRPPADGEITGKIDRRGFLGRGEKRAIGFDFGETRFHGIHFNCICPIPAFNMT
jgi:hypothetical protein